MENGTLEKTPSLLCRTRSVPMQREEQIPYYAPDGSSLGFRSLEAAKRWLNKADL